MRRWAPVAFVLVLAIAPPTPATDTPPKVPCSDPEYRQFDFWLGEWDVTNVHAPDPARPPAHSHITRLLDGCAILEEFDNPPRAYSGKSLNLYSRHLKKWHQTWIDNQGGPLFLEGGLVGKDMVLEDDGKGAAINRITWTPLDAGRVRQHWQTSKDGGRTWETSYDGLYVPKAGASAPRP
jgi:hypothetical protein